MYSKYKPSTAPFAKIKNVQFCLLDSDEIKKMSVLEIESTDLYEKGYPKSGGLYDLRMGTTDKQFRCQTCNCDVIDCPGHFGHIELHEPLYNIIYLKTIQKVLQCVCLKCSEILTRVKHNGQNAIKQLKVVHNSIKKQQICEYCNYEQPKLQFDNQKISIINEDNVPEVLTAKMAFQIFRKITNETARNLGFDPRYSHPKNMFIVTLLVPPPVVRPSVIIDSVMKSQDDLTHKLAEILKCNDQLKKISENSNTNQNVYNEFTNLLQFHINSYIDNEVPGQPQATQRTGRPIKSISQRLKSKEGRVRGNLMGKRVDFSARTVITADPNIQLDELGVPEQIANNMTIPEKVTNFNKTKLQNMVDTNKVKWITKEDFSKKDLRFAKNVKVEVGDTVERILMNGDYVVFNRQPSLHKMSMMGHKVRIMPNLTFRLNLSATSPYNADFDKPLCRKQEA